MLSFIYPVIVLSMFMLSFIYPVIVLFMFMLSFINTAIVLSMFMLSFIFVIVGGLFDWKQICAGFPLFAYICISIGDPIIKRGGLGSH